MKVVVIGNGFDLACNLPTRYDQFFSWRFKSISSQEITDISDLYFNFVKHKYNIGRNFISVDFKKNIILKFKGVLGIFIKNKMSFWDVYFYLLMLDRSNIHSWYDVEKQIENAIIDKDNSSLLDNILLHNFNEIDHDLDELLDNTSVYDFDSIDITQQKGYQDSDYAKECILGMFVELSHPSTFDENLGSDYYFLDELKKFENSFKTYLNDEALMLLNNSNYYANCPIYIENFKTVLGDNKSCSIINFNYTSIKALIDKSASYTTSSGYNVFSNSHFSFFENNVHGSLDANIIFGIDHKNISPNSAKYIFTKTYRKLNLSNSIACEKLPQDATEIIFYGHSLSNADYSYFQSLFDYYDIYHKSINLTFKYSHYDESIKKEIDKNQYFAVSKLIHTYGATMDNKDHGKNLLHKLLLENRLKLECISLQSIKK